tara:strand:- start:538 stop:777 length:240 start_codon:yes stop_codon:yes gene_type:complete
MKLYDKQDIIKENEYYVFFEYGLFNKQQLRFLTVYNSKTWGRHCLYKNYEDLSSTKRLKYKVSGMNPTLKNVDVKIISL